MRLSRVFTQPARVVGHVSAVATAQAVWTVPYGHVLRQRLGARARVRAVWTPP